MRIVRLKPYRRAMQRMGLNDDAMREVEAAILAAPEAHPIVQGLQGARKVRFARPGMGKRGGGRAIYYLMLDNDLLGMLTADPKSAKEELTPNDRKAILRAIEALVVEEER